MRGCSFLHDPGPCPVDDAPHHTCTAASTSSLVVPLRRPRVLDTPPAAQRVVVEFTTASYRRTVHGKALRDAQRAARAPRT
jgi:hypothetical protein